MTVDPNDPERLMLSANDAELCALLEAGRGELPTAGQLDSLAARLGPMLGGGGAGGMGGHGGAGGGQVAGAAAKKLGGAALAKAITAAALATVLGVSAVHAVRSRAKEEAPAAPVAVTIESPAAPPSPAPPVESAAPVASSAPARSSSAPRAAASSSASANDPDAEVRLLQRAQDALASDPVQSLALSSEHGRRFPKGLLSQEREVLAIEALMNLGRTGEAHARADRFRAAYPSSTHLSRIDSVLGGTP